MTGREAVAVYGPSDTCVHGLRPVADLGAELILLNPQFDEAEQMELLPNNSIRYLPGNCRMRDRPLESRA